MIIFIQGIRNPENRIEEYDYIQRGLKQKTLTSPALLHHSTPLTVFHGPNSHSLYNLIFLTCILYRMVLSSHGRFCCSALATRTSTLLLALASIASSPLHWGLLFVTHTSRLSSSDVEPTAPNIFNLTKPHLLSKRTMGY